jgi:putative hemolysin
MNPDPEQSLLLQFLILVVLTALNAFFSASEMAFVSLNKSKIMQKAEEEGDVKAQKILAILQNPSNLLSAIQVGITLINILAGASLADNLARQIAPLFGSGQMARTISSVIALAFITYFSIVFGELYPKRLALTINEKMAGLSVGPLKIFSILMLPFIWLLTASTNAISRLTRVSLTGAEAKMTRDEMAFIIENEGSLDETEVEMMQGLLSLDEKVAREVMVPRTDSFMIDIEDDLQENLSLILDQIYSRIPVYEGDKDKVIGVLHTKTLLVNAYKNGFDNINLREILQEPLFVPETIFIDDLLLELKRTQNQMAILLDEYSGMAGLVTLEDLLEEIVGEIDDETDEVDVLFTKVNDSEYIVQGRMLINEFNEEFDTNLEMDDVDTMAGYFLTAVGSIPDMDEEIFYEVNNEKDHLIMHKQKMEGPRILELRIDFLKEEDETQEVDEEK